MDQRKRQILRAVTDDYISTAEPVGSRTIARKYDLGVSPATIRNEMADLEEAGYLKQPHTSAGRIPSTLGYRYYVDVLMSPKPISPDRREKLRAQVASRRQVVDEILHNAARVLSILTQYLAIVVAPPLSESTFRHLQLVSLDPRHLLVIVVTEPGFVQNRIIELPAPIDAQELTRLNHVLNRMLDGVTLSDVTATLVGLLRDQVKNPDLLDTIVELLESGLERTESVYFEGTTNLFEHPEFHDVERAKLLLQVLEERDELLTMLSERSRRSGITVSIGEEHSLPSMQDCSMVTATYSVNGRVLGMLGLLGPTRMDYSHVVAAVEFMADNLSEVLTQYIKR